SQNALRYYYRGSLPVLCWGPQVIEDRLATTKLLRDLQHEYDRLWLVSVRPWGRDPNGKLKTLLGELYPAVEEKQFAGVGVYCYRLAHTEPTGSLSEAPSPAILESEPARASGSYETRGNRRH